MFDYLENLRLEHGGEYQLTGAIKNMARDMAVYAVVYEGRCLIGNKLEWLKANVELAMEDEELSEFGEWLFEFQWER